MIIDAHMHLTVEYSNFNEKKNALFRSLKDDGTEKGVVIADSWLVSDIGSNEQCIMLFDGDDRIKVVAGISPFVEYDSRLVLLDEWLSKGKVAGIKIFCGHEPVYIDDVMLEPVYEIAKKYSVPVLFHSGWDNAQYASPERVLRTASAHPEVTLVCCHCFYPEIERCFEILKDTPNVVFDTSSVADSDKYLDVFRPILEKYISVMPERFVFGSDYNCCSRKAHIEFFSLLNIDEGTRDMLFCGNAERLYKF